MPQRRAAFAVHQASQAPGHNKLLQAHAQKSLYKWLLVDGCVVIRPAAQLSFFHPATLVPLLAAVPMPNKLRVLLLGLLHPNAEERMTLQEALQEGSFLHLDNPEMEEWGKQRRPDSIPAGPEGPLVIPAYSVWDAADLVK